MYYLNSCKYQHTQYTECRRVYPYILIRSKPKDDVEGVETEACNQRRCQEPTTLHPGPGQEKPPVEEEREGQGEGKYGREELCKRHRTVSLGHGRHNADTSRS
jgi:hypothetical protein